MEKGTNHHIITPKKIVRELVKSLSGVKWRSYESHSGKSECKRKLFYKISFRLGQMLDTGQNPKRSIFLFKFEVSFMSKSTPSISQYVFFLYLI